MKVTIEITNDQFALIATRLEAYKRELEKEVKMLKSQENSWESLKETQIELEETAKTIESIWQSINEKK